MHLRSLETTQEARAGLGLRFSRALQTSRVHPQLATGNSFLSVIPIAMYTRKCYGLFLSRFNLIWAHRFPMCSYLAYTCQSVSCRVPGKILLFTFILGERIYVLRIPNKRNSWLQVLGIWKDNHISSRDMKQIVKQEKNLNWEKEKNYLCSRQKTFPNLC